MKRTMIAVFALQVAGANAVHATPVYDRALEAAAKRMVAERIGDLGTQLRGTFDARSNPEYSSPRPKPELRLSRTARAARYRGLRARAALLPVNSVSIDRVVLTGSVMPQR